MVADLLQPLQAEDMNMNILSRRLGIDKPAQTVVLIVIPAEE
ncbi:hypothetical protein [Oligella sp. HMSC09E12]|nr:hypothetical protein [Oligella sp. HMSC09E12]